MLHKHQEIKNIPESKVKQTEIKVNLCCEKIISDGINITMKKKLRDDRIITFFVLRHYFCFVTDKSGNFNALNNPWILKKNLLLFTFTVTVSVNITVTNWSRGSHLPWNLEAKCPPCGNTWRQKDEIHPQKRAQQYLCDSLPLCFYSLCISFHERQIVFE